MSDEILKNNCPNNIINSLTLLRLVSFNGIFAYGLDNDGKTIRTKKFSVLISLCHYVFYISCVAFAYMQNQKLPDNLFKSEVAYYIGLTYKFTTPACAFFILAISLLKGKELRKILKLFLLIEQKMFRLSINLNHNRIKSFTRNIILVTIIYCLTYTSCLAYLFQNIDLSFALQTTINVPEFSILICALIFVSFTYILMVCLEEVNTVRNSLKF